MKSKTSITSYFGPKSKRTKKISKKVIPASQKPTPKMVKLVSSEMMMNEKKSEPLYNGEIIPESDYDRLLDEFDYDSNYGPVVGISRMTRFKRAQKLNCNPPSYIKDIILRRPSQECFLNTCGKI